MVSAYLVSYSERISHSSAEDEKSDMSNFTHAIFMVSVCAETEDISSYGIIKLWPQHSSLFGALF